MGAQGKETDFGEVERRQNKGQWPGVKRKSMNRGNSERGRGDPREAEPRFPWSTTTRGARRGRATTR